MPDFKLLLLDKVLKKYPDCPRTVPWSLVQPYNQHAITIFDKNLIQLNSLGGLDPVELHALLENRSYPYTGMVGNEILMDNAVKEIIKRVELHGNNKN